MKRLTLLLTLAAIGLPSQRAHAQASVVGQWGTTQPFPIISVHTCLMPDGKVIFWDYSGNTRIWVTLCTLLNSSLDGLGRPEPVINENRMTVWHDAGPKLACVTFRNLGTEKEDAGEKA